MPLKKGVEKLLKPKVNFKELKNIYKKKSDKYGQGSLVGVILASVIGTVIVGSLTQWYLSMNKTMSGINDRLEAMTIAMSEWQRLEHMSLDELEANRENYKNPYDVGEKFKVGVTLGEQGFFDEGKCNSLTGTYAGENANCFKDTIMTVYDKDGNAMYTTRSLPLSVSRDSFPEGTILPYTGDLAKIPRGWVLCDGNNGTPDLRGRFLEGTGTTTGEFKMAGLPNIEGRFTMSRSNMADNPSYFSGAFKVTASGIISDYSMNQQGMTVDFDASRSNPIYGRSETVQPKSYTVFYIMKTNQDFHYNHTNPADTPYFYTKEEVDQLLEDERKNVANNYLNKYSKDYVRNLTNNYLLGLGYNDEDKTLHGYVDGTDTPFASQSNMKFPDYSKEQIYQISNGEKFIALENGWVTLLAGGSPRYPYNQWYINNYKASFESPANSPENSWPGVLAVTHESYTNVFIPISKGDYVTHWGSDPGKIYFYPMKD